MPRPPILNKEKQKKILAILSSGCGRGTAAQFFNCDPRTIANTAQRDPEFAEKLAEIENSREVILLRRLDDATKDPRYWRSISWSLERGIPEKYAHRAPDSVSSQQVAELISRVAGLLLEEVPVARYQKKIVARLRCMVINGKTYDVSPKPYDLDLPAETPALPNHSELPATTVPPAPSAPLALAVELPSNQDPNPAIP
jgi:hypothetical protein